MLRIRLSRVGKRNKAQFRVTVAEGRRSPTGRFIEILGHYNPHTKEKIFKKERVVYWISKGAKPSPAVHNFLIDAGIIKGEKVMTWKPKKKEEIEEKKEKTGKAESEKETVKTKSEKEAPVAQKAQKEEKATENKKEIEK